MKAIVTPYGHPNLVGDSWEDVAEKITDMIDPGAEVTSDPNDIVGAVTRITGYAYNISDEIDSTVATLVTIAEEERELREQLLDLEAARNGRIRAMARAGYTHQLMADVVNISRQRVGQICKTEIGSVEC